MSTSERALADLGAAVEVYRVGRKLALLDDPERVVAALARLAAEVVPADAGLVLLLGADGRPEVQSSHGSAPDPDAPWLAPAVAEALHQGRTAHAHDDPRRQSRRPEVARALVVPLRFDARSPRASSGAVGSTSERGPRSSPGAVGSASEVRRGALVVAATTPGRELDPAHLSALGVVAVLGGDAWSRAHALMEARHCRTWTQALVEGIGASAVLVDPAGTVLDLTPAAASILGLDRRGCVGRNVAELDRLADIQRALGERAHPAEPIRLPVLGSAVEVRAVEHAGGQVWSLGAERAGERARPSGRGPSARYRFEDIVSEDPAMGPVLRDAQIAATRDVPVLVTGESGTGKELLAQAIHLGSGRAAGPFVAVNVAAIPGELLESELFGYEAGAFTGARAQGKPGSFELADGGTLLLDEIGEMVPAMQSKLLRVLQEREVVRLGDTRPRPVDARIVATTNRDLDAEVRHGRYRLDLYHRLRVVHLELPPLRHRVLDIDLLARHFLRQACEQLGRRPVRLSDDVVQQLRAHRWPGNVRELHNLLLGVVSLLPESAGVIEELPIFPRHPELTPLAAPPRESAPPRALIGDPARPFVPRTLEEVERRAIEATVEAHGGNVSQAARVLGISRTTLYAKLRGYRPG